MITLFKDDYGTPIVFTIKTRDKVIPLIGSKVIFDFISKATNSRIGGGECEILDVNQGKVKYIFKAPELATLGEFQGKSVVDLTQGAHRDGLALEFKIIEVPKQ
jgi:hypothetical protein